MWNSLRSDPATKRFMGPRLRGDDRGEFDLVAPSRDRPSARTGARVAEVGGVRRAFIARGRTARRLGVRRTHARKILLRATTRCGRAYHRAGPQWPNVRP